MNAKNAREKYNALLTAAINELAKKTEDGLTLYFNDLTSNDKEILLGAKLNDKSYNGESWEFLQDCNDSNALQAQFGKAIMLSSPEKAHKFVKDMMLQAMCYYSEEIDQDIANMIQSIELDNGRGF